MLPIWRMEVLNQEDDLNTGLGQIVNRSRQAHLLKSRAAIWISRAKTYVESRVFFLM